MEAPSAPSLSHRDMHILNRAYVVIGSFSLCCTVVCVAQFPSQPVLSPGLPQATVLEEMPPFPERESSILAKLKRKKGPGNLPDIDDARWNVNGSGEHSESTEGTDKVTAKSRADAPSSFSVTRPHHTHTGLRIRFCYLLLMSFLLH